jgi:hypothetical protein
MSQKTGTKNTVILATRVTPRIKDILMSIYVHEGLNFIKRLRNLIIMEPKRSEALPNVLRAPIFDLEMDYNE